MSKLNRFSSHFLPALQKGVKRTRTGSGVLLSLWLCGGSALANGNAEAYGWQFQTSADKANQAIAQDMIQKRQNGYYAAPVYNTNIARQFNCNVSANSTGNEGTNSTVANSPSTSGAASSATGNGSSSDVGGTGSNAADSSQSNSGTVGSGVNGSTSTSVHGSATQALNSNQGNSGAQTASVGSSSACMFGAIN